MKKAIILARVSTPEQQKQGLSIEEIQLPKLRQYAMDNNLEVIKEFVFQETASQKLRKKFDEMIDFIKTDSEIKAIIGFRVDRLTRNYRDAVEMDSLRIDFDKELHFVDDRLVLTSKSFGRDIVDWDMKVFLAKQHINRCQEDTHNTIQSKLRTHEVYGRVPYGYKNCRDENTKKAGVMVLPFESGIVKKIFDWYSSGSYSYLQISQKLKLDINADIYKSKVEKILKNPFYYGMRELNGEIGPHKYATLVTKDVWQMCESVRNRRYKNNRKGKFVGKHGSYRGLIYCKECGCSMTPELHTKKQKNGNIHSYIYYHCTGARGKHEDIWIEEKSLTKQFSEIYKKMHIPKTYLQHMVGTLKEAHEGKINFNTEMFDEYNNQIKKLEGRIERLYIDKLDGSITQEEYDNLRKRFRQEQQEFKDKLARLEQADEEYYINASYLLELASKSFELFTGSEPEEKREIIQLTLQNLSYKAGKIIYTMQKPFDSIFETSSSLNWGGWWDSNPRHSVPQTEALTN